MENLSNQSEREPHGSQLLFDAYQQVGPSPQELQTQRDTFAEAASAVISSYVTEDQRETAQIAAGIFEWFHFGGQGDELPYGLLNVANDTLDPKPYTLTTHIDGRVITRHDLCVAWHAIIQASATPITGQIARRADIHPVVKTELTATIEQSQAHKLVQAISAPNPNQSHQQPLTPMMRTIRESQVTAEVLGRHNIRRNGHVQRRSPVHYELGRSILRLDDETMPKDSTTSKSHVDSYTNARCFFEPHLLNDLRESEPTNQPPTLRYEYSVDGEEYVGYNCEGGQTTIEDNETFLDLSESTCRPGEYAVSSIGQQYLQLVCNEAHGKFVGIQKDEPPFQYALETTIEVANDYFTANPAMDEGFFDETILTHRAFLYGATGPTVHLSEFEEWAFTPRRLYDTKMAFISRDEFYAQSTNPAGYITKPDFNAVQATRLIQTEHQRAPLPKSDPNLTLAINLTDSLIPVGEQIVIPGYKTVSFDPVLGEWGFKPDPDGEPYVRAEVPLPKDGRLRLAAVYDRLQLDTLADFLRQSPDAQVADLTDLIKKQTEYLVPVSGSSHAIASLDKFSNHIVGDRLYTQCTGSALFTALSIDLLFGVKCTSVQAGHAMNPSSGYIPTIGHAQVAFNNQDQIYMIDTSAAPSALSAPANTGSYALPLQPRQLKQPRRTVQIKQQQASSVNLTGVYTARQAELFKRQLIATYKFVNTDQLYDEVAALPEHDPVRTAFVALDSIQPKQQELQQAKDHIKSIIAADDATLSDLRLKHYRNHPVLDMALKAVNYAIGHM